MVRSSSIVQECYAEAAGFCARACQNLSLLPDTADRRALVELADYVVRRRK